MNFKQWYDEADMPEKKIDGQWVDLETGIPYKQTSNAPKRKQLSNAATDARAFAKSYGGKALAGTAKQKEWAETLRAEILKSMSDEACELICDPNGLCTHSKFWIENRAKKPAEFELFIITQKSLLRRYKHLKMLPMVSNDEKAEAAQISVKYNSLIKEWGIS